MILPADRECIAVWAEHGIPDVQTLATVPALLVRLVEAHDAMAQLLEAVCDEAAGARSERGEG